MKPSHILFLFMGLMVSACSGIVTSHSVPPGSSYYFHDIERSVRNGGLYAEVVGNPFGGSSFDFERRVRRLMDVNVAGVPMRFVEKSSPLRSEKYHVVVWFNPTQDPRRLNLCTHLGGVAFHRDPKRLEVAMALCAGKKRLTEASGIVHNVQGQESPVFRELVASVTGELFPQQSGDVETRQYQ